MKRREFIKFGLRSLAPIAFPSLLQASNTPLFDDYKAIVILYLNGGNDGINTFIPVGTGNDEFGYDAYLKSRGSLAVLDRDLSDKLKSAIQNDGRLLMEGYDKNFYVSSSNRVEDYIKGGFYLHNKGYKNNLNFANQIATHSFMPELAHYVNEGRVAIIQNVGNLIQPTTKKDIYDKKANLPLFLMAHNHQGTITATADGKNLRQMGVFGRLADEWAGINKNSVYGMNISLTSNRPRILYGYKSVPNVFNRYGMKKMITALNDRSYHTLYRLTDYERTNPFKRCFNKMHRHSIDLVFEVTHDWKKYDDMYKGIYDAYGKEIDPKHRTKDDIAGFMHAGVGDWEGFLLNAAKLIKIGIDKGLKRQVFFVSLSFSGFDTHAEQRRVHGMDLRRLSLALDKFQRVIDFYGFDKQVTTILTSEFGRSIGSNGDGSDHAWGSHLFAMGGAVKGGLYGERPSLKLGGDDDMSNKGRLIPKISMSQFYNTLMQWFGVDENLRLKILPELKNFPKDSWNIGFMES